MTTDNWYTASTMFDPSNQAGTVCKLYVSPINPRQESFQSAKSTTVKFQNLWKLRLLLP
jgi:hypothetical protein